MATAARKPCSWPGCPALVGNGSRCDQHRKQADVSRGTASERGYSSAWRKAREGYLRSHPLCAECQREGKVCAATVVDHIKPHKGDRDLFWDRDNWQGLCKPHHDRKTASEDGGFGRVGGRSNL